MIKKKALPGRLVMSNKFEKKKRRKKEGSFEISNFELALKLVDEKKFFFFFENKGFGS